MDYNANDSLALPFVWLSTPTVWKSTGDIFWMKMKNWFSLLLQHTHVVCECTHTHAYKRKPRVSWCYCAVWQGENNPVVHKYMIQTFLGRTRLPNCWKKRWLSLWKQPGVTEFSLTCNDAKWKTGRGSIRKTKIQRSPHPSISKAHLLSLHFKCQLSHSKSCARQRASLTLDEAPR